MRTNSHFATPFLALVPRPGAYITIVLVVATLAAAYGLRENSLFACQASGYGSDTYLAYCQSPGYGDYDYGAFWFGLEPAATKAASEAQVLFLGNSRMQFGLSSEATSNWFAAAGLRHYLLGFAYDGNYRFAGPLMDRVHPKAQVYVLNLDLFFEQRDTPPARLVMKDASAKTQYQRKRLLQSIHLSACASVPALCGHQPAFFRSQDTGAWHVTGGEAQFRSEPVSFDESVDATKVQAYTAFGDEFLSRLRARRECTILTIVPGVRTPIGTASAVANALGRPFIAPRLEGLQTFDASHLDSASAERWSQAFFAQAAPEIQKCLGEGGTRLQASAEPTPQLAASRSARIQLQGGSR